MEHDHPDIHVGYSHFPGSGKPTHGPCSTEDATPLCRLTSLPPLKKEVMFLVRSVCLFVCLFLCLSVGLLANLWTDFDEIFCRGRAWLKNQVIQFWWQSGSRFGSGSPKSEIRILRIAMFGRGLFSLSASSSFCVCYQYVDGTERVLNSYFGRLFVMLLNLEWTVIATVFSTGIWKSS